MRANMENHGLPVKNIPATVLALILLSAASEAAAQSSYYRHIFFDNGPHTAEYFNSSGKVVAPSTLEVGDGKLPLDTQVFFTPPNSIRISWSSNPGGAWAAAVHVLEFRNREILFDGDTISFWLYSTDAIPAASLPDVRLHDTNRGFSSRLPVGEFSGDIPAKKWTRVRIPLRRALPESVTSLLRTARSVLGIAAPITEIGQHGHEGQQIPVKEVDLAI
jgi:exo beta-1,2-glucooligosaccharide sophorohydrolase (non-reducing end)